VAAPSFPSNMDVFHEKIDAARKPVSRLMELVTSFCAWEKKRIQLLLRILWEGKRRGWRISAELSSPLSHHFTVSIYYLVKKLLTTWQAQQHISLASRFYFQKENARVFTPIPLSSH